MVDPRIKALVRDRLFRTYSAAELMDADRPTLARAIDELVRRTKEARLSRGDREALVLEIIDDMLGWGPLSPLLDDPEVFEIMINGPSEVFVDKNGKRVKSGVQFDSERHLLSMVQRMARENNAKVDELHALADLVLPGGIRVNVALPPIGHQGPLITLRKPGRAFPGLETLVDLGSMDVSMSRLLWACVKARMNILFSGGTASGKTTLLEILTGYIDENDRVVLVEDTPELRMKQGHHVRLLTRRPGAEGRGEVTLRDLFKNAMRMSPSRILLGEIRGGEAFDFLQALTSGHDGCMAVLHAATPAEAALRLENLVALSGLQIPTGVVRNQIAHGLDLVVQVARLDDGSRKVTHLSEVAGITPEGFLDLQDIFVFEHGRAAPGAPLEGWFRATGYLPRFFERFQRLGLSIEEGMFRAT